MRVEDGDVRHIPQPAVRAASLKATLVCLISLSFVSAHELHLQGVESLFVSLVLISDKGSLCFLHRAVVPRFWSWCRMLTSATWSKKCVLGCGFFSQWFPAYDLAGVIFFLKKGPQFIHCNRKCYHRKWYWQDEMAFYCWENLSSCWWYPWARERHAQNTRLQKLYKNTSALFFNH